MKFTLKDYQSEAVSELLDRLRKARKRWHEDKEKSAFPLSATTGAGKTVMAAAVFEALFFGNDAHEFHPDPSATVVWFSDDPSLNEQSRFRLMEASDKLTVSDLVTVDSSFVGEKFAPGKIYFLNTQKFSRNSLLVRGHDPSDSALETSRNQMTIMPDLRQLTIWDVIKNTIDDPDLTLYLVLDEAHRGMQEAGVAGRQTIVKKLINGERGVPGVPVVWGISATIERFNTALAGMEGRTTLPHVSVDAKKVQESGLLKDTIVLDIPGETGDFETVLLRRATRKLKEISHAWAEYGKQQGDADIVLPLMVLQVPNTPDPADIGIWIDTIFEEWPDLPRDCVANVFGQHADETFGRHIVKYISPERVQESTWVRILIAKDAISTGWDCPRAEVMVSFRSAQDRTNITQLLGRMVRTPLARRIPGNERLNSVDCLLPKFNKETVQAVADQLMTGVEADAELTGRRILINAIEMVPNPQVPESVWAKLLTLPSQSLPKKQARPIKRLTALAHELAADGLLLDAGKKAHSNMHTVLDGLQKKYAREIREARSSVLTVDGMIVRVDVGGQGMAFDNFVEDADYGVIEEAYKTAGRMLSPDLATSYSEYLVSRIGTSNESDEILMDAHTMVAALALVPEIKDDLEKAAELLSNQWLEKYRLKIKDLSDERQEVYREIREMSVHPLDVDLARPQTRLQATTARTDGREVRLPRMAKHLLCDSDGLFPVDVNALELRVLEVETGRSELLGWYRNPASASQESLGITYKDGDEQKIVRPDFIFFTKQRGGKIVADIIDPHGRFLGDALPKMQGLAKYAEAHGAAYGRIEVCDEVEGVLRAIDLNDPKIREVVFRATSATEVYRNHSRPYR